MNTVIERLDCHFVPDTAPVFDSQRLEQLLDSARRIADDTHAPDRFFDIVLESSIYLCLYPMKNGDDLFFSKFRFDEDPGFWRAAQDARGFVLSEWASSAHKKGSVLDDLDAVLGSLISAFTHYSYSYYDNMIANSQLLKADAMGFPDPTLLRYVRRSAQKIFPEWDNRDIEIYTESVFALLVCLNVKYRFKCERTGAANWCYDLSVILFRKKNAKFLEFAGKAFSLVDMVYGERRAKMYRPAVVLWHIFRVLRRMSEGIACDEWMKCGCEPECKSCDYRFSPEFPCKLPE